MRFFNTAGPMKPDIHYCIPPLERLDAEQVRSLIRQQKYFVLHAPRQTGKTSALLALQDELNASGQYRSVYVNVEVGQSAREDVAAAMQAILSELSLGAEFVLDDLFVKNVRREALEESGPHDALRDTLSRWAANDARPLVLLIDEIDALVGDTLVSVLRQLRAGYAHRPSRFPQSIILCGIRDVRDYRIHASAEKAVITGGSAFNIKSESLRMGDFSAAETQALLSQHTEETGQAWTEATRQEIWRLTQGQPWLVNALAYRACEAIRDLEQVNRRRSDSRGPRATDPAPRDAPGPTHRQAPGRARPARRRAVAERQYWIPRRDSRRTTLQYVRDLGLVRTDGNLRIANPIYQEAIPRDLTWTTQVELAPRSSLVHRGRRSEGGRTPGRLPDVLPGAFRALGATFSVPGSRPATPFAGIPATHRQQRRTYRTRVRAGGRMRTDLLIVWPLAAPSEVRKTVIECKLLHGSLAQTTRDGLEQTRAYMDRCAAGRGPPRRLRPHRRPVVGRQDIPPYGNGWRVAGNRMGHVNVIPHGPVRPTSRAMKMASRHPGA